MDTPILIPPEYEPEFLIRPAPGRQEGPRGYLLRLAEANCLTLAELEHSGTRFDLVCLTRNKLLPAPGLDPGLHSHVGQMDHLLRNKSRIWNTRYVRFCPQCLAEDPTWRAGWEVMFHDVCPHHGVWLIDQCSSCEKPVRWHRDSLLRCQCGSDLRQEMASPAPENAKRLSGLLESRLLGLEEENVPVPLAQLDLEQTQRLIRYVGGYLDPNSGAKPLKLRNAGKMEVSWPVTSLAAEMLFQWPNGFNAAFSRLQEASLGVKTGLSGLFQQAYRYIYKGLEEKSFAPVRDAFEEWVAEFWKGGVARRNRRLASALLERIAWIPGKVAADRLGITTKRLRHLVEEGLLEAQESISPTTGRRFVVVRNDGLEAISKQLASEMDMATAMKAIGLCKLRMQQIIRLLFPTARRLGYRPGAPWLIPRDEVEALLAIGESLPVVSIPDEGHVSVAHALRFWGLSSDEVVALVNSVKAGKLSPVALISSARGMARWVFESNVFKSWHLNAKQPLQDWLTNAELSVALGCRNEDAYWLVKNQFLASERLRIKKNLGSRVHRSELERFRERYVFAVEIARELNVSPGKVKGVLAAGGIVPASGDGIERCRKLFYERSERLTTTIKEFSSRRNAELLLSDEGCLSLTDPFSVQEDCLNKKGKPPRGNPQDG